MLPPARRTSARTNATRSPGRVIFWHVTFRAPALVKASSRALPLAPPAWTTTRSMSSAGFVAYFPISAIRSLPKSCAERSTTTRPPPNSDGEVSSASPPRVSVAGVSSCTSASDSRVRAAVTTSAIARSMSSSSSPTTRVRRSEDTSAASHVTGAPRVGSASVEAGRCVRAEGDRAYGAEVVVLGVGRQREHRREQPPADGPCLAAGHQERAALLGGEETVLGFGEPEMPDAEFERPAGTDVPYPVGAVSPGRDHDDLTGLVVEASDLQHGLPAQPGQASLVGQIEESLAEQETQVTAVHPRRRSHGPEHEPLRPANAGRYSAHRPIMPGFSGSGDQKHRHDWLRRARVPSESGLWSGADRPRPVSRRPVTGVSPGKSRPASATVCCTRARASCATSAGQVSCGWWESWSDATGYLLHARIQ